MRVGGDAAVPRKMLARGRHTGLAHARHIGMGDIGYRLGIAMKGAIADDTADATIQVQHRRQASIDTNSSQLSRHQPAAGLGEALGAPPIFVVKLAKHAGSGQRCETAAKPLDAPPFLIDQH